MRIHVTVLAAIALALALGGLSTDDPALADGESAAPSQQLVYDVRIVHVLTPTVEGVEAPCPFLRGDETTTALPWPEILAALKKRGTTRILMDQRVTGHPGRLIKASEERQVPRVAMQSKTLTGENYSAMRIRTGCNVDVMAEGDGSQFYKVMVRGAHEPLGPQETSAIETLNAWEGTHRALDGRTLVLTHRQQWRDPSAKITRGEAAAQTAQGSELYCFLHGRRAAGK